MCALATSTVVIPVSRVSAKTGTHWTRRAKARAAAPPAPSIDLRAQWVPVLGCAQTGMTAFVEAAA